MPKWGIKEAKASFNTLGPRQDGRYFADDVLKCILLNENAWILLKIPLKLVPKGPINNIPALVQIMAWRRPGDKPLSEPMLVFVLTHICVTRLQWVNKSVTPLEIQYTDNKHEIKMYLFRKRQDSSIGTRKLEINCSLYSTDTRPSFAHNRKVLPYHNRSLHIHIIWINYWYQVTMKYRDLSLSCQKILTGLSSSPWW